MVAIVGHGRFGAALGKVMHERGITYAAYDPHAPVPERVARTSVQDVLSGARFVVVSVPVPKTRAALTEIRPYLNPGQIVVDVGSVKVSPTRSMQEVFGDDIPWVATHPLFGPSSLALGVRPLPVVVCPNEQHRDAVTEVEAFWKTLGCVVAFQTAEDHDRDMAFTHALTYFVAKGMLEVGAGQGVPHAPPSFHAIARTIDMVRSDAGHLFSAIHRENPFAADARASLLQALNQADAMLRSGAHDELASEDASALSIPAGDDPAPELRQTRELIDELDQELVTLLSRRAHLSRRALRAKQDLGRAVRDDAREAELFAARRRWAESAGLEPEAVESIFTAIVAYSRRVQGER